jgi:hypothetical protein
MYALVEDNNITKIITNPKSMVIGDVRYPAKIFQLWSQSELNAIGIYEVITDSVQIKKMRSGTSTQMNLTHLQTIKLQDRGELLQLKHTQILYGHNKIR